MLDWGAKRDQLAKLDGGFFDARDHRVTERLAGVMVQRTAQATSQELLRREEQGCATDWTIHVSDDLPRPFWSIMK